MKNKFFTPLRYLYFTQFVTAFADNAIFFVILAMIKQQGFNNPDSYMGTIQAAFLLAFVLFAPIVGAVADKNPKARVLLYGNLVKGLGTVLLFTGFPPALAYGIVGIGAVIYSPAKYGILPELTNSEEELLKANSKVEAYTIMAILGGTVTGGFLGEYSVTIGIVTCLVLFGLSFFMTLLIPRMAGNPDIKYGKSMLHFFKDFKTLFKDKKLNFALIGSGSFWMVSSVLRLAFLVFVAKVLLVENTGTQSMIVASTAIGIVIGSLITPIIIPTKKIKRVFIVGILLVPVLFLSVFSVNIITTVISLLVIGFLAGIYIVPMNTVVQHEGEKMIGSGKTVAIQNFINNAFMLVAVGAYQLAISFDVDIKIIIVGIGVVFGLLLLYLSTKIKAVK